MLGDVASALENGTIACLDHDAAMRARGFDTAGGYVAVVEDGHLSWEPPEGWVGPALTPALWLPRLRSSNKGNGRRRRDAEGQSPP
ncbi:hypothetical protein [Saccharopolyspora hattusasensis]|uniref:hypothetical protein n=1 Tax=Saccharopolyspora hattusasensis TaxID=1128679 RepID=UPI003D9851F3